MKKLRVIALGLIIIVVVAGTSVSQSVYGTRSLAWSPNGQFVATIHTDNAIRIWSPITGQVLQTIQVTRPPVFDEQFFGIGNIGWDPTSSKLLYVLGDMHRSYIAMLDLSTMTTTMIDDNGQPLLIIYDVDWSADGQYIAAASANGMGSAGDYRVLVFDAQTRHLVTELQGGQDTIFDVNWSPSLNSHQVFVEVAEPMLWDVDTNDILYLVGHEKNLLSATWNPDGSAIATTGQDNTVRVWNAATGQMIQKLSVGVEWYSDAGWMVTTEGDDQLILLNDSSLTSFYTNGTRSIVPFEINADLFDVDLTENRIVVSPDSNSIVIYDEDGNIIPFVLPTLTPK